MTTTLRCQRRWGHAECGARLTFIVRDGIALPECAACQRQGAGFCADCPRRLTRRRARYCPACRRRHAAAAVQRFIARDPDRWRATCRRNVAAWRARHGQAAKDYKRAWDRAHRRKAAA